MARERFTAWVTKYALTEGILKMLVEDCFDSSPTMVRKVNGPMQFFHSKEWHRSHKAAKERAEEMRNAKLVSLIKQQKKIAALKF